MFLYCCTEVSLGLCVILLLLLILPRNSSYDRKSVPSPTHCHKPFYSFQGELSPHGTIPLWPSDLTQTRRDYLTNDQQHMEENTRWSYVKGADSALTRTEGAVSLPLPKARLCQDRDRQVCSTARRGPGSLHSITPLLVPGFIEGNSSKAVLVAHEVRYHSR